MRFSRLGACLVVWAIMAAPLHAGRPVPGAYAIRICKSACPMSSDEGIYAHGTVMLFGEAMDPAEAKRLDPSFSPDLANAKPNGCFVLARASDDPQARYASAKTSGLVNWAIADGRLRFSLYLVVDSGYAVSLHPTAEGFGGEGHFWGDFPPTPKPEKHRVDMTWIGAADEAQCQPARASWLHGS